MKKNRAKRFEDLEIWQLARELAKKVWELSNKGTFAKDFKLRGQINGAAGSVMDNIAEGFERNGAKEFIQFLYVSKGSAGEVRSQSIRAFDRGHITREKLKELYEDCINVSRKIMNFIKSLKESDNRGYKFENRK